MIICEYMEPGGKQVEKYYQEVVDLCSSWWSETMFSKELDIKFEVNEQVFLDPSIKPYLFGVMLRDSKTMKLVGTYVGYLCPYIFSKKMVMANEMVWCVEKSLRGMKLGSLLMENVNKRLKELKVDIASLSIPDTKYKIATRYLAKKNGYILGDSLSYKRIS